MAEVNFGLLNTDPVAAQNEGFNYADKIAQSAAKYKAGAQYGTGDYAGAATTQANAGDIPAAQATTTAGQASAQAAHQYIAQAIPVFQGILQAHANDPDKGAAAIGDAFDHIAPEISQLTGHNDQALATLRQNLVADPQGTLNRIQAMVPITDKIVGDTDFRFQGARMVGSLTGAKTNTARPGQTVVQSAPVITGPDGQPIGQPTAPAPQATPPPAPAAAPPAPTGQQPLGIRSNNPGNLQPNGQEAKFSSPTAGILAASQNLDSYAAQGINTIAGIVSKWAPPTDATGKPINDTASYIASVSKQLGVDPNAPLNLHDPNVKGGLLEAMFHQENGAASASPAPPAPPNQPANGAHVLYQGGPQWRAPTADELKQYPGATQINAATGQVKYPPPSALAAGMTDDQIQPFIDNLKAGGTLPQSLARNPAMYARVLQGARDQGVSMQDILANQGNRKATQSTFQQINTRYQIVQGQEEAFQNSLNLAKNLVQQAGAQGGGQLINDLRNWIKTGVVGDPKTGAAINALDTAMNEYAKIIEGSTGNAGSSVSARADAHNMLSLADNIPAVLAKMDVLKQDAAFKIGALKDQHDTLQSALGSIGDKPAATATPSPSGGSTNLQPGTKYKGLDVLSPAAALKLNKGMGFYDTSGTFRVRN